MSTESQSYWRLVDLGSITPELSAAADEAILNARRKAIVPDTVHFYVRDRPCISIGYNRSIKETIDVDEIQRRDIRIIRRLSGGSAIYTDQGQLIFGLAIDSTFLPMDVVESYQKICGAIIRGLSMLSVHAEYKPVNDILVNGLKISGSAQLRRGGIVLHHGTLLIDTDIDALTAFLKPTGNRKNEPKIHKRVTCLREILGKTPDQQEVKQAIAGGISETFGIKLESMPLTPEEKKDIDRLIREKYAVREWIWRL